MSVQILTNENFHGARPALEILEEALSKLPMPQKRRHVLYILSCYVSPEAIQEVIDVVAGQVRVTSVQVLFDYGEVWRHGPASLQEKFVRVQEAVQQRHGTKMEWKAIRPKSGALVHAKGYAVAELNAQQDVEAGCLFFGSANATAHGLGLVPRSNVELGSFVTTKPALRQFCVLFQELWQHETVSINSEVDRHQEELFRFALLRSGIFLVKWSGNLKSQLSIRYKLTAKGRKAIAVKDKDLVARGFEADQSSLMKNYLKLPVQAKRKDFPRTFSANYTIESSLGRWCPGPIWALVEELLQRRDEAFLFAVATCLGPERLAQAARQANDDLDLLRTRGMVDIGPEHIEAWEERMAELRTDRQRLLRVRHVFSDFLLPYGRENVDEIQGVYESIEETVRYAKRTNVAMRHFVAAAQTKRIGALKLNKIERDELHRLFTPHSRRQGHGMGTRS